MGLRFIIREDPPGQWRWRLATPDDKTLAKCHSAFPTREDCLAGVDEFVCAMSAVTEIIDATVDPPATIKIADILNRPTPTDPAPGAGAGSQ